MQGLLHRPDELAAADRAALLPAAAAAGAQVRASGAAVASLRLRVDRPRAFVVVGARAPITAALFAAVAGPRLPVPVLGTAELPGWIGPLDVVVVLAAEPGDASAASAAEVARRRGAAVVVRGAAIGPVAAAAGPDLVIPGVGVPEALGVAGRLSLVAGVAALSGLIPAPDWAQIADLLDQLALASHPGGETFVNPAVGLAEHLSTGVPLLVGADTPADAVAGHGGVVLAEVAGVTAAVLTAADAANGPVLLRRLAAGRDIFADLNDSDDEPGAGPPRPVLISSVPSADHRGSDSLVAALPGCVRLSAADLMSGSGPADPLARALGLLSRLDFAAVYLSLALGQLPLPDSPDGLARRGSARTGVVPVPPAGPSGPSEPWGDRDWRDRASPDRDWSDDRRDERWPGRPAR